MVLKRATLEDVDEVLALIGDLSRWLRTKGIRQWSDSFPRALLEEEVGRGELYVARDGRKLFASVGLSANEGALWGDLPGHAVYLHRLTIDRAYAGRALGKSVMESRGVKHYAPYRMDFMRFEKELQD